MYFSGVVYSATGLSKYSVKLSFMSHKNCLMFSSLELLLCIIIRRDPDWVNLAFYMHKPKDILIKVRGNLESTGSKTKYNKTKNNLFKTAVEKTRDRTCHKQGTL